MLALQPRGPAARPAVDPAYQLRRVGEAVGDHEVHRQRLRASLAGQLRLIGFRVRILRGCRRCGWAGSRRVHGAAVDALNAAVPDGRCRTCQLGPITRFAQLYTPLLDPRRCGRMIGGKNGFGLARSRILGTRLGLVTSQKGARGPGGLPMPGMATAAKQQWAHRDLVASSIFRGRGRRAPRCRSCCSTSPERRPVGPPHVLAGDDQRSSVCSWRNDRPGERRPGCSRSVPVPGTIAHDMCRTPDQNWQRRDGSGRSNRGGGR